MKTRIQKPIISLLIQCAALLAGVQLNAQAIFTVDPTQTWIGYMNVFELPSNGGGYDFGSPWATSALGAYFTGPTLTLTPNFNIDQTDPVDSYWWQAPNDGSVNAIGNHTMAASMYVQQSGYAGGMVTFTGDVLDNTLITSPTSYSATGISAVAFIDDFTPSFALVNTITTGNLASGVFSISLNITPGDVLQYGFITTGPDERVAEEGALGQVDIIGVPEPTALALAGMGLSLLFIRRRNKPF